MAELHEGGICLGDRARPVPISELGGQKAPQVVLEEKGGGQLTTASREPAVCDNANIAVDSAQVTLPVSLAPRASRQDGGREGLD